MAFLISCFVVVLGGLISAEASCPEDSVKKYNACLGKGWEAKFGCEAAEKTEEFTKRNIKTCSETDEILGGCGYKCPVWTEYTEWTECTEGCGKGTQTRTRTCINEEFEIKDGIKNCNGKAEDTRKCKLEDCEKEDKVNGKWSEYGEWSDCRDMSENDCGKGFQSRTRTCTNPAPVGDGKPCNGKFTDDRKCSVACDKTPKDKVDGNWSDYEEWSDCLEMSDGECGKGYQTRSRTCTNPAPLGKGKPCKGSDQDKQKCKVECEVPVDGQFGEFGSWSKCSAECDGGKQERSRECNNPSPANGGKDCAGEATETSDCNTEPCIKAEKVDGGYSNWGQWSDCSTDNGVGTQTRTRLCNNPTPENGGAQCSGDDEESKECRAGFCYTGLMETDQKQYFKDLFPVGESLTTYTACIKPEVGTFFELKVDWTGEYTENCGMSFNLFANDCLYHLDFRVNNKGSKNIGVQDFEIKKKWQKIKGSSETLDLKKGSNIVRVYLDPDFYHAFINGANRNEIVDMKEEKLNGAYKNIRLFEMDTGCISIDMEKSFIDWSRVECTNAGNCPAIVLPVDGRFGVWGEWSECSTDNGIGVQTRTRACDSPKPLNGGAECEGETEETKECRRGFCYTGLMETEQKQYFTDFKSVFESETKWTTTACRPPTVGTVIELQVDWTGANTDNCCMSFNLMANDNLYHLNFRVNCKGSVNTLLQSFEIKKKWQSTKEGYEDLNLRKGANKVQIYLHDDFYRVFINGQRRSVVVDMKEEKLVTAFKYFQIFGEHNADRCLTVNKEKSFIDFSGAKEV